MDFEVGADARLSGPEHCRRARPHCASSLPVRDVASDRARWSVLSRAASFPSSSCWMPPRRFLGPRRIATPSKPVKPAPGFHDPSITHSRRLRGNGATDDRRARRPSTRRESRVSLETLARRPRTRDDFPTRPWRPAVRKSRFDGPSSSAPNAPPTTRGTTVSASATRSSVVGAVAAWRSSGPTRKATPTS